MHGAFDSYLRTTYGEPIPGRLLLANPRQYRQFKTVVTLRQQLRVVDEE